MKKVTNLNLKTKQDFIDFFSAIPDNKWCKGSLTKENDCHCALGHLGIIHDSAGDYAAPTRQVQRNITRLARIFIKNKNAPVNVNDAASIIWHVNDSGYTPPKTKILNALKD